MRPKKDQISPYATDRKAGAAHFGVSERTVIRWLDHYGLYQPKPNYGGHKLNIEQAESIRELHKEGVKITDLATQLHVTPAAISRIVHNLSYRHVEDTAKVSVIYNPKNLA